MSLSASYASVTAAFRDSDGYVSAGVSPSGVLSLQMWLVIVISPLEAMGQRMGYVMG